MSDRLWLQTVWMVAFAMPSKPTVLPLAQRWKKAQRQRMIGLKKLDIYILKKFLLLFVAAFFICLFVFMMQFTWRYVDDLIGKGLSLDILAKFFWYMGLVLVPQALPLSVLLASLITFGNLGESFELLAMKAAGIPLIRVMRPLIVVSLLIVGVSFEFQNDISPKANLDMRTLLLSMKQQSPAVEIPEGVFYSGVPNVNLYVQKKNAETGMLYQLIIYKTDQGFDRAQIVLADSGRMEMSADKMHLLLHMWSGEQFESLQGAGAEMMQGGGEAPYDRETFGYKKFIIDFDANFNMMDKNLLNGMAEVKNRHQIEQSVDSMELSLDSVGKQYYKDATALYYRQPALSKTDSVRLFQSLKAHPVPFDSLMNRMDADKVQMATQAARNTVQSIKADLEWKALVTHDGDNTIRRHWVVWHQMLTLSLVCLLFFFIGAPLGAIIRKGGLGVPVIISVIVFIIRYIIEVSTMKMARDGNINMTLGMWTSTIVILPLSVFVTYKANRDSGLFNMESYVNLMRRLLGLRTKRHIFGKEVIIHDPRMELMPDALRALRDECRAYNQKNQLLRAPSYIRIFFRYTPDTEVEQINEHMEALIEELSNSRNRKILGLLNEFPILYTSAHTTPFHSVRLNRMAGVLLPLGFVLWFRIWRFRLRLLRDLRITVRTCDRLLSVIDSSASLDGGEKQPASGTASAASPHRRTWMKWLLLVVVLVASAFAANALMHQWKKHKLRKAMQTEQKAPDANAEGNALPQSSPSSKDFTLPAQAPDFTKH